jgi:catechol 2,3-dioxygenase
MSATSSTPLPTDARLGDATRLGAVELTVTDLDRSIAFYQDAVGLQVHRREDGVARLGAGREDLVVLRESPFARAAGRHAGLYHVALLYGSREELARATERLAATRVPVQGASDHGTHEAIYLPDPDGNGLELAADRPRSEWPELRYLRGPDPLDLRDLLATVEGQEVRRQADENLRVGHVHLHVGDLEAATRFYRDGLGFDVKTQLPSAVFVSAGGYHHHVGFNTWQGEGAAPAPADAVGLRHWTLEVSGEAELAAVRGRLEALGVPVQDREIGFLARDPSGTAVVVVPAA